MQVDPTTAKGTARTSWVTQPTLNTVYVAISPGKALLARHRRACRLPGSRGAEPVKYDVAKAKQLMEEAGASAGFALNATYPNVNQYGVDYTVMMQKIQQDLDQIKIHLNLEPVEFTVWRQKIKGDGIPLTAVCFAPDYFGSRNTSSISRSWTEPSGTSARAPRLTPNSRVRTLRTS